MNEKIKNFLGSARGAFVIGALVGLAFFAAFYGLAVVNPTNVDWIWQPITHDTAQHYLGWQFFRVDATGGIINGLAYPEGLSLVFMDVIPLLALIFKPFSSILPANFQYFGMWGLLCYVLMGGLAAVLLRRIWRRLNGPRFSLWQLVFTAAGSLILVLSPMVMARTFYHPALAGQWIILLGFIAVLDVPELHHRWLFVVEWSALLTLAVLIHPYFLPMMGALMLVGLVRYWPQLTNRTGWRWLQAGLSTVIPALAALGIFAALGGFSLGSGAEVYDLEDKGFNLLSFVNSSGYSALIPGFANRSSSPETLMWLGAGVIIALLLAVVLSWERYRVIGRKLMGYYRRHTGRCWAVMVVSLLLLIFAMSPRIDAGAFTLLHYPVPDRVYQVWTAFRAAAREAWPFYYLVILLIIYWLGWIIRQRIGQKHHAVPQVIAIAMLLLAGCQAVDMVLSPQAQAKYHGFYELTQQPAMYRPLDLSSVGGVNGHLTSAAHLVALDDNFRDDQSGTYVIGQTALRYHMTLNTGFFARVPAQIKQDQADWRQKLIAGQVGETVGRGGAQSSTARYLFFTGDETLAKKLEQHYQLTKIDRWWFVTGAK